MWRRTLLGRCGRVCGEGLEYRNEVRESDIVMVKLL